MTIEKTPDIERLQLRYEIGQLPKAEFITLSDALEFVLYGGIPQISCTDVDSTRIKEGFPFVRLNGDRAIGIYYLDREQDGFEFQMVGEPEALAGSALFDMPARERREEEFRRTANVEKAFCMAANEKTLKIYGYHVVGEDDVEFEIGDYKHSLIPNTDFISTRDLFGSKNRIGNWRDVRIERASFKKFMREYYKDLLLFMGGAAGRRYQTARSRSNDVEKLKREFERRIVAGEAQPTRFEAAEFLGLGEYDTAFKAIWPNAREAAGLSKAGNAGRPAKAKSNQN